LRRLGLDIGDKRIGLAVSDELNVTAQGKEVLIRTNHRADLKKIKKYIDRYNIGEIIVGLPKNLDNTESRQGEKIKNYVNFLRNNLEIPIKLWDERLSTRAAEDMLLKADLRRKKRREVIDQVAASIILQNYLDYMNRHNARNSGEGNNNE